MATQDNLQDDQVQHENSDAENILGMSDEDMVELLQKQQTGQSQAIPVEGSQQEDEQIAGNGDTETAAQGNEGDSPNDASAEGVGIPNEEASDEGDDDTETQTDNSEGSVDYKAFYESLTRPFKANGAEFQITSPEEAISLMQKGLNYTAKMQDLATARRYIQMLQKHDLLDESKLAFLIEINEGNPNAIAKLLQEKDVDLYDGASVEKAEAYTTDKKLPSVSEIQLQDVIAELQNESGFAQLYEEVAAYDQQSVAAIVQNPELLRQLYGNVGSGYHSQIKNALAYAKALGRIPANMSYLEAYSAIGHELAAHGKLQQNVENNPEKNPAMNLVPKAPQTKPKRTSANDSSAEQKRKLNPSRKLPNNGSDVMNALALSDEEFIKQFAQR